MAATDLDTLMNQDLPEGRGNLLDSYTNLERVAEYCESNYFGCDNKRAALEETKGYTTQSLASVAYQINTLAYNFLQMLDLQANQIGEMESQVNHISQTVAIHKEKVARREIGILTTNKCSHRQYKIIAPATAERPIKYVRRKIDFSLLDDVGHGVKTNSQLNTKRSSSTTYASSGNAVLMSSSPLAGPAPTTKPPTPPQSRYSSSGGTLNRSKDYRALPIVAPPQVPSNYAPNFPIGATRNKQYGTLPHHGIAMVQPMQQKQAEQMIRGGSTMPRLSSNSMRSTLSVEDEYLGLRNQKSNPQNYQAPPLQFIGTRPSQKPPSPPLPPPPQSSGPAFNSSQKEGTNYSVKNSHAFTFPYSNLKQTNASAMERQTVKQQDNTALPSWVPMHFIEKVNAIYDYNADKDDELSFMEGSIIYVIKKNDDGWWEGIMDGVTGLFPGNYVESIE